MIISNKKYQNKTDTGEAGIAYILSDAVGRSRESLADAPTPTSTVLKTSSLATL